MSILSSTQGTPERVWSLVSLVAANDGRIERVDAANWLNPTFLENGKLVDDKESFAQVQGAATALGALTLDYKTLELTIPRSRHRRYIITIPIWPRAKGQSTGVDR